MRGLDRKSINSIDFRAIVGYVYHSINLLFSQPSPRLSQLALESLSIPPSRTQIHPLTSPMQLWPRVRRHQPLPSIYVSSSWPSLIWVARHLLADWVRFLLFQGLDPSIPLLGMVTGLLPPEVCSGSERRSRVATARHEVSMRNEERLGNSLLQTD